MQGPQRQILPDGRRLHLHHGPIDLIIDATGPGRAAALRRAAARFETILDELVGELCLLRTGVSETTTLRGEIARAMHAAVAPYSSDFVTPMAAVAGAVADAVLGAACAGGELRTLFVNNGGDVALFLAPGEQMAAAVAAGSPARILIRAGDPVRGVATSGWRGRSHSLGIADSVTVLAPTAAAADAAATLIANHVDLPGNPKVRRRPASEISPDSDLGERPVTVAVAPLSAREIAAALDRGVGFARKCLSRGLFHAALITLAGHSRTVGSPRLSTPEIKEIQHA